MASVHITVLCVVLAGLHLASTAPNSITTSASTASDSITTSTSTASDALPLLGRKLSLDHCDDMQGLYQAIGLTGCALLSPVKCTIKETLTEEDGVYSSTLELYTNINGAQRKVLTTRSFSRLGQEVQKYNKLGQLVKYTVTRDGNTLTKVWSRGDIVRGTTTATFTPREVKTAYKINGATYNCVYKPECLQGDLSCDNNV